MRKTELLPHELAPGVFALGELLPVALDNTYKCESHDNGDSAIIADKGLLEFSGYTDFSFDPKTPGQKRDKKVAEHLRSGYHPTYQHSTEEASRVANLVYYDSSVSGYVGQLVDAHDAFENTSRFWEHEQHSAAETRRANADLFLRLHTLEIIGLKGYFDLFNFEGDTAVSSLKKVARSLKTRTVTQRRLNVYDSGAYIASRRGDLWAAINNSKMSDMPYFNYAAPLAGLAVVGLKKQHTSTYENRLITPVVIGKDNLPYLAPSAFQIPFTLRQN